MRRLILIATLVTVTFAANTPAQRTSGRKDSITVQACHITFNVPPTLKRNRTEGIDSCIVEFENRNMLLSIDYGWYGGAEKKSDVTIDFKEQSLSVGGKTGTLATYVDNSLYARRHPERKYVAHLYVVVKPDIRNPQMTTSLTMTVRGRGAKELDIADRIFRSVRFG
jgi:hypothetical protein